MHEMTCGSRTSVYDEHVQFSGPAANQLNDIRVAIVGLKMFILMLYITSHDVTLILLVK